MRKIKWGVMRRDLSRVFFHKRTPYAKSELNSKSGQQAKRPYVGKQTTQGVLEEKCKVHLCLNAIDSPDFAPARL